VIKGALPVFEQGVVDWPDGRAVHDGTTPAGRSYRAASPYVRDWVPDDSFARSLDRALDVHFDAVRRLAGGESTGTAIMGAASDAGGGRQ
jgi:hypothetical protein